MFNLRNCSLKMRAKNFKNYFSILAILNYCNWMDASLPLNTKNKKLRLAQMGMKYHIRIFVTMEETKFTTGQIVNLEMKKIRQS